MMKLRYGYLFVGFAMGLFLLWQFLTTLPDGNLRITICDVGQGDSSYLRFPDGRDMLVDGGPSSKVLRCLGNVMPFWDRRLDAVVLTHPDQDHFKGLIDVLERYQIGVFVHTPVDNPAPLYQELKKKLVEKKIRTQTVTDRELLKLKEVTLDVLWPAQTFLSQTSDVLGASSLKSLSVLSHRNDYGIVFHLKYGAFDAVFTADVDARVQSYFSGEYLTADGIELLKVPHHGSRTGMTDEFLSWLMPRYAVISVGKNNRYAHPSQEMINRLDKAGAKVYRTDQNGSISIVTDGKRMKIWSER
jgi:competence protein ComEC